MSVKKRVVILGSTGSIGESALKVARDLPERMEIVGLAAGRSAQALLAQAAEFKPRAVALYDTTELDAVRRRKSRRFVTLKTQSAFVPNFKLTTEAPQ